MSESFLERITGEFLDGTPLLEVPQAFRLCKSIGDHITYLLNTKQGMLAHIPDYGIPDAARLYRGLPGTIDSLKTTLLAQIRKFEPRLQRPELTLLPFKPAELKVKFQLKGYVLGGIPVAFSTEFSSTGMVQVDLGNG